MYNASSTANLIYEFGAKTFTKMKYVTLTIISSLAAFSIIVNCLADPLAFANAEGLAIADSDGASYDCHSNCGYAILAARKCSPDGESDAEYDSDCLCKNSTQFLSLAPKCLDCGWCLWSDYGSYLTSAFQECGFSTQPTGTSCLEDKTSYLEAYGTVSQTVTSDNPKASSYASNNAKSIYSSKNDTITSTSSGNGNYSSGEVVRSITSSFSTFESNTSSNSFDSTASTRSDSYSDSSSTISNTSLSTDAGNSISLGFAPIFLAFISIVLL